VKGYLIATWISMGAAMLAAAQTRGAHVERWMTIPGADDRALLLPCRGASCANALEGNRVVFRGDASAWRGFELCRQADAAGEQCVRFEEVFGR
jgi:hypothetical protein